MAGAGKKKVQSKAQEVTGKVKESAGKVTGREHLRAKGTAEKAMAQVEQAARRSKDAATGKTRGKHGS